MPEHLTGPQPNRNANDKLQLLQINFNKSEKAHLDIINERVSHNYDIILIQEPYTTTFNAIRMPTNFRPVFPAHRLASQDQIHSVIWVNRKLDMENWKALNIPDTNNITAIQLRANMAFSQYLTFTTTVLTPGMSTHFKNIFKIMLTQS